MRRRCVPGPLWGPGDEARPILTMHGICPFNDPKRNGRMYKMGLESTAYTF